MLPPLLATAFFSILALIVSSQAAKLAPLDSSGLGSRLDIGKVGRQLDRCVSCEAQALQTTSEIVAAKSLQDEANYQRRLRIGAACNLTILSSGDNLEKLFQAAVTAVACPDQADAANAARKWQDWWDTHTSPIKYDTRNDADRFLYYIIQRRVNRIADCPENLTFEAELIKEYEKSLGIICQLKKATKYQEAEAKLLQQAADRRRNDYSISICAHTSFGQEPVDIIYGAALHAVKCENQTRGIRKLAKKWRTWWKKAFKANPCDTRDTADRFLEYALERRSGELTSNEEIDRFEEVLANDFLKLQDSLQSM